MISIALLTTVLGVAAAASISDCPGYTATNVTQNGNSLTATLTLAGDACNVYGNDINDLQLLVEYQTQSRLHVKILDAAEQVYQIPPAYLSLPSGSGTFDNPLLNFTYIEKPFSFAVVRTDTGEALFNTSGSNLIFETQYIRLRTQLPTNPYIYGLGEDSDSMRRPTTDYTRTLWNVGDAFLRNNQNLYGSHPVYYEMRNGTAHGVYLANSNGMDIKINSTDTDGQYLEYNSIGGVFDFYFLAGPSPSEVSQQYAEVVGTPAEQAYWTYGFHQCKYGWPNVEYLAEVVQNYSNANIPLEVLWSDIDYMDRRRTWTLDPVNYPLDKMQQLVSNLHNDNQSFIMMVDPAMSFDDKPSYNAGLSDDVFLRFSNGSVYVGGMWPGATSWVDWLHPNADKYWSGQVSSFFNDQTGVAVDGIWIDMNEPADFCSYPCRESVSASSQSVQAATPGQITRPSLSRFPYPTKKKIEVRQQSSAPHSGLPGRNLMNPPYQIRNADGNLYANTIDMDLVQTGGYSIYDTHNYFANGMQIHTRAALESRRPGKRPFVISRSTAPGTGNKTGHWTGDNASQWSQYLISIRQNMEFATFFQIPTVGADVCGFNLNTTESLCQRWAVLGAWYPFYRNHADISANNQEFYLWPSVTAAAQAAIKTRMQLMDYFYTAFHYQSVDGIPRTILPLFYLYPQDQTTLDIDLQFFYGESLLVSPVVVENSSSVNFYLPQDTFYDFFSGQKVLGTGSFVTRDNINYTDIVVHIKGGTIIPLRVDGANNTRALRELDFDLVIAPAADGNAVGRLFLDDGESIVPDAVSEIGFKYNGANGTLVVDGTFAYQTGNQIRRVVVLGEQQTGSNSTSGGVGGRQGLTVDVGKPLTGGFSVQLK